MNKRFIMQLIPLLFAFFSMGFVDVAGIAANYMKADFALSDFMANTMASMVFFWFFICSVPTGMLMNKIGRRKTVLISLYITLAAVILPFAGYSLPVMLAALSLLGIGNAMMQVSLNPLLSNIVPPNHLSSMLTLGQFIKAIAAFFGPIGTGWFALHYQDWRLLFAVFAVQGVVSIILLSFDRIPELAHSEKSSFSACLRLLRKPIIFLCFLGIMCHVGIDVGINMTAPKVLMENLSLPLTEAGFATSVYFLFRTAGSLIGVFALAKMSARLFFTISVVLMLISMCLLPWIADVMPAYVCLAGIGLGNANIFPVIFAQAMRIMPDKKNEVSGLMIMGICGGALFPSLMGYASDSASSHIGAVVVMAGCIFYLLWFSRRINAK